MAVEFIPVDRDTPYIFPPSLQNYLPDDHLARFEVDIVDQLDLNHLSAVYSGRGFKPFHLALLVALLFYAGHITIRIGSMFNCEHITAVVLFFAENHLYEIDRKITDQVQCDTDVGQGRYRVMQ